MFKVVVLGVGIVLLLGGIVFFLHVNEMRNKDADLERLFEAPEFLLTNSSGKELSKQDLQGTVWVVDFIFTRCAGPCPLMTQRMKALQTRLKEEGLIEPGAKVALVSISVDPGYDKPEVLATYAVTWGADTDSWHFLTGPKEQTLQVIREGFKITASGDSDAAADDTMPTIIHSTNFLLVDQSGWIRRIHHMEDPEMIKGIVKDVRTLLDES